MKERLSIRVETQRLAKLRKFAELKRKTMTQIVEDLIDDLPDFVTSKDLEKKLDELIEQVKIQDLNTKI